jgi:hypothetical protein
LRRTKINAVSAISPVLEGVSQDDRNGLSNDHRKRDRDEPANWTAVGQARSCDRQTCNRSRAKSLCTFVSQPCRNTKEQSAETASGESTSLFIALEHILRNESQQQRHADAQVSPLWRNRAAVTLAQPNHHCDQWDIQKPKPVHND